MKINEQLRQHVTRVGFDLSLGRTHIAALVMLKARLRENEWIDDRDVTRPFQRTFAMFVGGARGLQDRGLVWHRSPVNDKTPINKIWGITKAGDLVCELLKESGIWAEYEAALPVTVLGGGRRKKAS